jgi:hypothetical protein
MKKLVLAALCLTAALPAAAQLRLATEPLVVRELTISRPELYRLSHPVPHRMDKESNLSAETTDTSFIFPVVGNARGANNTFFRSETSIANNRNIAQDVALFYYPATGSGGTASNCNLGGKIINIPAGSYRFWGDFVGDLFGNTGLGSVIAVAINANQVEDPNADLDGFSRIYTPVAGTNGQASQSFPGVVINVLPGATLRGLGLRHDSAFRTNIGIFNYDFVRQLRRTFTIVASGPTIQRTYTADVDPCNLNFFNLPTTDTALSLFSIAARANDGGALWYGFGSSNDNSTGDNWSVVFH